VVDDEKRGRERIFDKARVAYEEKKVEEDNVKATIAGLKAKKDLQG